MPSFSKSHWYVLIVPSVSLEADALKVMFWPGIAGLGLAENAAVGVR